IESGNGEENHAHRGWRRLAEKTVGTDETRVAGPSPVVDTDAPLAELDQEPAPARHTSADITSGPTDATAAAAEEAAWVAPVIANRASAPPQPVQKRVRSRRAAFAALAVVVALVAGAVVLAVDLTGGESQRR